nr:RNA-directed DNA polymerase, eukaryota, reverse transcriptase zinc-binding domain protein [Tanacetum cinerariifolium]
MGEEFEAFEPIGTRTDSSCSSASSDSTTPLSPDHPLTHVSPTPTPTHALFHHRTARKTVRSQPAMSHGLSASVTEELALSDSAFCKRYRSFYATPSPSLSFQVRKRYIGTSELILDTNRERERLVDEGHSLDDEGHGLDAEGHGLDDEGRGLEGEGIGSEEEELYPRPTLTTWVDPKDGRVYTDIPVYVPPVVPSPIASPVGTSTTTISVVDDQFLERYMFRSLEREQERTTVAFRALWRPVLALEAWAGRVDTRLADISWDRPFRCVSDISELWLQEHWYMLVLVTSGDASVWLWVFEIEKGVEKRNTLHSCFASRIKNIDGKILGKDGKPIMAARRVQFDANKGVTSLDDYVAVRKAPNIEENTQEVLDAVLQSLDEEVTEVPTDFDQVKPTGPSFNENKVEDSDFVLPLAALTAIKQRFARALIEMSADRELKENVIMVVPLEDGTGHTKEHIRVEYVWKPPTYIDCHVFGHSTDKCPKRPVEPVATKLDVQEDGFTTVTSKRKKGKKQDNRTVRHIKGLKFNMLKSLFVYHPVNTHPKNAIPDVKKFGNAIKLKNPFDILEEQDDLLCDSEWDWTSNANSSPTGCRIIVGWNVENVDLMVVSQSNQALHVKILHKAMAKMYFCSFIYAGNTHYECRHLWAELGLHKHVVRDAPWILRGDFSVALNMEDNFSGSSCMNLEMCKFKDCVFKIEMLDINSFGLHFTWNSEAEG